MSYIIHFAELYEDKKFGDGHCVRFLQEIGQLPITVAWKRGQKVKNADIPKGTCIATFSKDGVYENKEDGSSHAAVYVSQSDHGLIVYDQWIGKPVSIRTIWFRNGKGDPVNDGDQYYVIE